MQLSKYFAKKVQLFSAPKSATASFGICHLSQSDEAILTHPFKRCQQLFLKILTKNPLFLNFFNFFANTRHRVSPNHPFLPQSPHQNHIFLPLKTSTKTKIHYYLLKKIFATRHYFYHNLNTSKFVIVIYCYINNIIHRLSKFITLHNHPPQ